MKIKKRFTIISLAVISFFLVYSWLIANNLIPKSLYYFREVILFVAIVFLIGYSIREYVRSKDGDFTFLIIAAILSMVSAIHIMKTFFYNNFSMGGFIC